MGIEVLDDESAHAVEQSVEARACNANVDDATRAHFRKRVRTIKVTELGLLTAAAAKIEMGLRAGLFTNDEMIGAVMAKARIQRLIGEAEAEVDRWS